MSSSNQPQSPKPDLEESIDVTKVHRRVERKISAAHRELELAGCGDEPVSVWLIAGCGIAILIACMVLGKAGTLFAYNNYFQENYVRSAAPGGGVDGVAAKPALEAYVKRGAKFYSKCSVCHGPEGAGDGSNFPSLVDSEWVLGDTEKFAMIILNGLEGPTSTGKVYGAGIMPSQSAGMDAVELATIMTYVRNSFGNSSGDVVTVEMAEAAFEISEARAKAGQMLTAEEIVAEHKKMLPGDVLDPEALVDPVSLQVVK